ncbi:ABC transporter permease [Propionicimonas sp.]|uniref:ABC transporter permease n=1 Tax=Propionicimonas sp. TaxID=1955623 RepID=UPI0017D4C9A1|nr:ABC transporter permease [Propionicimonas sp.]MBU3976132.1 ABC transporter permease [Actinomycetota bacterium]MBA3020944.1 ABC transporter permease subunit [Propionicimonas sp.]MBU3985322.1 ABC transporter permease [Actinomycetota bacterium]MBU4008312.1 ABC transporter permease [Actinomycetota bacterium]MBU4064474.1 ABC transporter permease [Actinomycetota bacterium]
MFIAVFAGELVKLRRTLAPWVTLGSLMTGPLFLALFMWIVSDPGRAAQFGLLGTKASLSGIEANWVSYASYLTLIVGLGGTLLLAFVAAYVFGREYSEGTAKVMLTLPVPRRVFVAAKLLVVALWWLVIVLAVYAEAVAVGLGLGLPGITWTAAGALLGNLLLVAGISYLLAPMVSLVTVWSRGYLAPVGFALGMLLLGNVIGHTGWAAWFPWSIVPILVGSVSAPADALPVGSLIVLAATFAGGVAATMWRLQTADVNQ